MANYTRQYKLPSGVVTTDVDKYVDGWRAVAAPIEQAMQLVLTGFDPTLSFRSGNPNSIGGAQTVQLPFWFAEELSARLSAVPKRKLKKAVNA